MKNIFSDVSEIDYGKFCWTLWLIGEVFDVESIVLKRICHLKLNEFDLKGDELVHLHEMVNDLISLESEAYPNESLKMISSAIDLHRARS